MRDVAGLVPAASAPVSDAASSRLPVGEGWARGWLEGIRPYALLGLLCLLLYVPGLADIPPLDRDEARFAQATRQMLETGDFIRIRFQDEARNKKPVGIYWLQATSVAALSTAESRAIWPYRVPSALAAAVAVVLTFAFGSRLLGSRSAAFVAAVLLACGLGVIAEAHLAKTDAALLAAIVAAQGALGLVYTAVRTGRRVAWPVALVFWLAEAAAILLKGPPGPLLALLTVVSLSIADRDRRWIGQLRPIAGILVVLLIVGPWAVAIESATDGRFVSDSILRDLLPKLVGAQESHGAPPGYYTVLVVASFWPGSLFIVPALVTGWRRYRSPGQRFLLAWLAPAWILFELVPTKLPHYVLPLYPALALLAGSTMAEGIDGPIGVLARFFVSAAKMLWGSVTVALATVLIAGRAWFGGGYSPATFAAAAVLLGLALLSLIRTWRPFEAAGLVAALAMLFVLPAALVAAPELDSLWLSRSAAALVAQHPPPPGKAVLSVGYSEPSLVFLLGTTTRLITAAPGDQQLENAGLALVSDRYDAEFRRSLTAHGISARAVDRVTGLDYSAGGGRLVLTLYALEPG
jgi:4-amino-4-deoxy-L-arabinose transferase-like glycosyltransferase